MHETSLDLFVNAAIMEEELKFALCEEFADEKELPVDYVYMEFVDPNYASFAEVQFVLSRF